MRRDEARTRQLLTLAISGAMLGHAVLLAIEALLHEPPLRAIGAPLDERADRPITEPTPSPRSFDPVAVIALAPDVIARLPLLAIPGPGDAFAFDGAHPAPSSSADLPGEVAADRGGGDPGGAASWTGRRDLDQTALRAQIWNGGDDYRAPRQDLDRRAATSEAIARTPTKEWGDRQARRLARAGAQAASQGDRQGEGAGHGVVPAGQADPEREAPAGATTPARRDGATRVTEEGAMVDRGEVAVDVQRHGAIGDDVAVAASSSQRQPDPFDLTPPRSGGSSDGEGVRGATADDGVTGDGDGHGTAASRADAPKGRGASAVYASRTDPYLRKLLQRLDGEIVFPRDLKLDLRSGRVIASLTIRADGRITDVDVERSSGFDGFDRELARALKAIGPLGAVPTKLLDGRRAVRVMVPYTFRNSVIR